MKLKKFAALLAAFALTLGLTGCIGNFYPDAMTVDGTKISSGLYLMMQYNAYSEAENKIDKPETAEEDESTVEEEDASEPEEVNVLKSTVEGQKASDWIAARTEELCRRYVLVERLCLEKGITLNEDGQSYLEQTMGYWEYLAEMYAENGINEDTFQRFLVNESLRDQLFQQMYGEDGELAPTDDEIKELYEAANARVRFISIPVKMSDEEQTDKTSEVEPLVDAMLEALKGGKTLEEVAQEQLGGVYELLEREFDPETVSDSISTSTIAYDQEDSDVYTPEFLNQLKEQAVGDYGSYNMGSTIMLYEKAVAFDSDEDFAERRATIISSLYSEDFDEYLASIYNNYTVTRPTGSQWYFRPSKIVD